VLAGAFLNLRATADFIAAQEPPHLSLVCSGTANEAATEDVLGAGALCDLVWPLYEGSATADSAQMARRLFQVEQNDLLAAISRSRNGRRLLARPDLREDAAFCAQRDVFELVEAQMAQRFPGQTPNIEGEKNKLLLQGIQLFFAFIGVGDGFLNANDADLGYGGAAGPGRPRALSQRGGRSAHSEREGKDADIFMT